MEIASITTGLAPLALLACPIGMGVMMWMMGRGNRSDQRRSSEAPAQPPSLEVLREEQRHLSEQIDLLERRQASSAEAAPDRR